MASRVWLWGRGWWVPAAAAVALLVMGEISQLLQTLSTQAHFSYGADALTGFPGVLPRDPTERIDAITAWYAWADAGASNRAVHLTWWLAVHLALDFLVFAPAYAYGLYLVLHRIRRFREEQTRTGVVPCSARQINVLVVLVLVADLAETFTTGGLVAAGACDGGLSSWAWAVTVLSWLKWVFLGATVILAVAVVAVDILPVSLTRWFIRWRRGISAPSRAWTRHRVQLVAVAFLAAVVVLPGGGPLEQFPDIERAWVHQDGYLLAGDLAGPVLTLVALSLAVWVAGRWALLDGVPRERRRAHGILTPLLVCAVTLFAACLFWPVWSAQPWGQKAGGAAIPLVALAMVGAGLLVRGTDPEPGPVRVPATNRGRVEGIGRALTVVPLLIAALGLVRAFARPVLLGTLVESDVRSPGVWFWFIAGLVLALLVPPVLHTLLQQCDTLLFGTAEPATRGETIRRRLVPRWTGRGLLALTALIGVLTAVDPLGWGSRLRTLGVLALFLTTVVLACAGFVRRAEARMPYRAFRALRFRFTPIWLPVLAVLVAQSLLDNTGVYHAVRLKDPRLPAAPHPFSSHHEFEDWYEQAAECHDTLPPDDRGNAIPMLLVAAAGGGIRAAYWTGSGMDQLTDASPCAAASTFGLSGVSGGSLGLAAHTLGRATPAFGAEAAPGTESSRAIVRQLAGEDALAANIAAMLYRDGTHALHGMNRMLGQVVGDRASVFERAWERSWAGEGNAWEKDYVTLTRHAPHEPGPGGGADGPVLILNGTDVRSGCRVAVSAHRTIGEAAGNSALRCQEAVVSHTAATPQFTTATVDAVDYTGSADCHTGGARLRMSTAAHLSARFTYVSPSGTMYRCLPDTDNDGTRTEAVSSIDGGYLENSGIATLLELWAAVEPEVAAHNRRVATREGADTRYVVPLLVFLDNHYSVKAPEPELDPLDELVAPLAGRKAAEVAARTTTLQQAALIRFSEPVPGLDPGTKVAAAGQAASDVRTFLVAPRSQPEVTAPLGWVLSDLTMSSMDRQMDALAAGRPPQREDVAYDTTSSRTAGDLSTARRLLSGPLNVTVP
ncbi:hypothetical protein [Streptomyces lateritius]|uniref:hypothetical protein n=1 Tax=Streptomyces lateritius TaxID=67313 RepID=UPI001676EAA9|nr:hypothetical protein [Streptomyces lateritius]